MPRKFIIAGGLSQFGSALSLIAFLSLVVEKDPVLGVTLLTSAYYAAIGLSGFIVGWVQKFIPPLTAIRSIEIFRACVLLSFAVFPAPPLYLTITAALLLYFVEGIYHPYRYHVFRSQLESASERGRFFTNLQSVEGTMSIIGPVTAGIFVSMLKLQSVFLIDAATYLLSFIVWARYSPKVALASEPLDWHAGYTSLFRSRALRQMIVARICGNITFIVWTLALPLWIVHFFPEAFGNFQGMFLGITACGLLAANLEARAKSRAHLRHLKNALIGILGGGIALFFVGLNYTPLIALGIAALAFGFANGGLRTGGILIGQNITPSRILHMVISAGDSIVRLSSAILAFSLGTAFEFLGRSTGTLSAAAIAVIFGILSIVLYRGIKMRT